MRAKSISQQEQYDLIMECRASGLSDHQWCMEHDIKPGTFYNWVKRLRKSGCDDIPAAARFHRQPEQEIVQVAFRDFVPEPASVSHGLIPALEVRFGDVKLTVSNSADPLLLKQTMFLLKELYAG